MEGILQVILCGLPFNLVFADVKIDLHMDLCRTLSTLFFFFPCTSHSMAGEYFGYQHWGLITPKGEGTRISGIHLASRQRLPALPCLPVKNGRAIGLLSGHANCQNSFTISLPTAPAYARFLIYLQMRSVCRRLLPPWYRGLKL